MSRNRIPVAAEAAPHSWDLEHWPQSVYPHTTGRARYMVRSHKDELLAAGALSTVGRELIVLGARYTRWLEARATHVADFEIAANRNREQPAA
jgi:hypothetical protein